MKYRPTRLATEAELRLLETQRAAFVNEVDALLRKYCMTDNDIVALLIIPGRHSATIFSDMHTDQQRELMVAMLGGQQTEVKSEGH